MSLIIEDGRGVNSTSSSQIHISDRHMTKVGSKTKTLRLDSPTTIEACQELGILIADLKPKTIEDFKDVKATEEIIQLRFAHYQKRYNQFVADVYMTKRQIMKAQQRNHRLQQQQQYQQQQQHQQQTQPGTTTNANSNQAPPHLQTFEFITSDPHNKGKNGSVGGTARSLMSHTLSPQTMKHSHMMSLHSSSSPLMMSYHKTVSYLRKSHETAEVKDSYDILGNEGSMFADESDQFDSALGREIHKFNKVKRQKQKEARDAFVDDLKRIKIAEELKERAQKKQEREKKIVLDYKKNVEEKKRKAQEKLEKIREVERRYEEQKQEEKERMKQRLEEAKAKIAEELEQRKKWVAEHGEKLENKKKIAEERRERLKIEEQAKADQLKLEIQEKLYQSQEKHHMTLNEKASRVKLQIQKIEESTEKMKMKQKKDADDYVQNLVEKLVHKEESIKAANIQHLKEAKRKEKEMETRTKRFMNHQADIQQHQEDKMAEINERFQKVQENLAIKREQEEKNLRLKQELRKLQMLDKQDNYNRKLRQIQHNQEKVLERERQNHEKLIWLKSQKEILQQAKVEASIQSKIERDRIAEASQLLSKLTNEIGSSSTITEHQKKILKDILTPEDYKIFEVEEKRKREAKLEAEQLLKSGMVPQAQSKQR